MISKETRDNARKYKYLAFLQSEVNALRLQNIQKLYDKAHITNEQLVRQLNKHTATVTDLNKAIFSDIIFILIERISANQELADYFDELYYKLYPSIYDYIRKAAAVAEKDPEKAQFILSDLARHVIGKTAERQNDPIAVKNMMRSSKYRIMDLLFNREDEFVGLPVISEEGLIEDSVQWKKRDSGSSELNLNDSKVVFTEEQEPVLQSKMFEKFIRKQKAAIEVYLGINEGELENYILEELDQGILQEDFSFVTSPRDGGIASMATIHVIQSNYGGSQWYHTICTSRNDRKGSMGYRPNFDVIVEDYYRARVMTKYADYINSGRPFTKMTLSRECKAESPKEDYLSLLYLYNIDIVYQMFKTMREEFYRNFSWENVTGYDSNRTLQDRIDQLQEVIRDKDKAISELNMRLATEKEGVVKKADQSLTAEIREKERIAATIDEKDKEIEELKRRLSIQDELIKQLNSSEVEISDDNSEADMSVLQGKRFLFVGHTEEDFPELNQELRKLFPDSIFMKSETDNIDQIKVDAVVVFLKWCSHGMYYKVKADNKLKELPFIYVKSKNIKIIIKEIYIKHLVYRNDFT